jgi:antitoxin ParD1/3/4
MCAALRITNNVHYVYFSASDTAPYGGMCHIGTTPVNLVTLTGSKTCTLTMRNDTVGRCTVNWHRNGAVVDISCQTPQSLAMPTETMNIALPDVMRDYVARRVESGQYGNTSEYVRDLIRKDQQEQGLARLRSMLMDGLASGPADPITQSFWDEVNAAAGSASE